MIWDDDVEFILSHQKYTGWTKKELERMNPRFLREMAREIEEEMNDTVCAAPRGRDDRDREDHKLKGR